MPYQRGDAFLLALWGRNAQRQLQSFNDYVAAIAWLMEFRIGEY